jgi:putative Mg2+ transporter-C (MgtC) family protein
VNIIEGKGKKDLEEIILYLRDFNLASVALRLILAMIMGGAIGIERGKQGRAAGMRTHILVCIGSALASMMGFYATEVLGMSNDPLRVAAQVVSGVSFLGVGTILLKGRFQITGLTTAAGIWTSAAIGLALGIGFYEGAIITFVCVILTVGVVQKLERKINRGYTRFGIYIEIPSDKLVRDAIKLIESNYTVTDIQVTSPRSGTVGNVGIEANIHKLKTNITPGEVARRLEKEEYVIFALESL